MKVSGGAGSRAHLPPGIWTWLYPRGVWTDCVGARQRGRVHWASVGRVSTGSRPEACYPWEQLPGASLPDLAPSLSCLPPADGFTPLMIASCSGGGLETGNSEEEEDAPAVISDFIYQGASLHNQTDRTGETALHLAARYSRSDAAKRLLEASADANIQDNMGRTPLHAAVSADAQGVFQVGSHSRALLRTLACLPSFLVWPQSPDSKPGQSRGSWDSPPPPRTFASWTRREAREGVKSPVSSPRGSQAGGTTAGEAAGACRGQASSPSPKTGPSAAPASPGPHALPTLAGGIDCLWMWGEGPEAAACCLQAAVGGGGLWPCWASRMRVD